MENQFREYEAKKVITFRKTTEPFGGLSNMAPGFHINVNGIIIPSVEHLYQACRFPLFPEVQEQIISEKSPITAKMISRKNDKLTRQDWSSARIKIMRWCLEIKLSQNWPTFSSLLLNTGDKPIVELTTKDKIWGAVAHGDKLVGVNALGRLLMELRTKVINNEHQLCIPPPNITGFLLYGHPIEIVCDEPILEEFSEAINFQAS